MSSQVSILFKEGIEKNYTESMKRWNPAWRDIFHVERTQKRIIDTVRWEGYGLPEFRLPGNRVKQSQIKPSFDKRFIMRSFGLGDSFAKEDLQDDLYGILRRAVPATSGMMANMYDVLMETEAVYMLGTLGYSSSTVTGSPDGKSLFNTAHPISKSNSSTFSNRPSVEADLSYSSAQAAAVALRKQKEHNNLTIIKNNVRLVVVAPDQEYVAKAVYRPREVGGTANRDTNYLADDGVKIVVWPYWNISGATGTNNAWFVVGEEHFLYWYIRSTIDVDSDFDVNTKSQIVTTDVRFDYGWTDPRGTYGSKGV